MSGRIALMQMPSHIYKVKLVAGLAVALVFFTGIVWAATTMNTAHGDSSTGSDPQPAMVLTAQTPTPIVSAAISPGVNAVMDDRSIMIRAYRRPLPSPTPAPTAALSPSMAQGKLSVNTPSPAPLLSEAPVTTPEPTLYPKPSPVPSPAQEKQTGAIYGIITVDGLQTNGVIVAANARTAVTKSYKGNNGVFRYGDMPYGCDIPFTASYVSRGKSGTTSGSFRLTSEPGSETFAGTYDIVTSSLPSTPTPVPTPAGTPIPLPTLAP